MLNYQRVMNWMSMSGMFMNEGQWPKHYEKHPTTPFMGFIHQHKKTGGHDLVQIATSRFQDSLETIAVSVTEGISGFGRPLYMETCTAVAYRLYATLCSHSAVEVGIVCDAGVGRSDFSRHETVYCTGWCPPVVNWFINPMIYSYL